MNDNVPTDCCNTLPTEAAMNAQDDTHETGARP